MTRRVVKFRFIYCICVCCMLYVYLLILFLVEYFTIVFWTHTHLLHKVKQKQ